VGYLALLKPADGAVELDLGIDQLRCLYQVPSDPERLEGLPYELDVLLRHRPRSISRRQVCPQRHASHPFTDKREGLALPVIEVAP
jgi:hypothetical protein